MSKITKTLAVSLLLISLALLVSPNKTLANQNKTKQLEQRVAKLERLVLLLQQRIEKLEVATRGPKKRAKVVAAKGDRGGNPEKTKTGAARGGAIESRIEGAFSGWEGETIVKLRNGQIWQQNEYYYHYHYAYMPEVVIFKSGAGYKMFVEGVPKPIGVTQLK